MSYGVQLLPPYINSLGKPVDTGIAHEEIFQRLRAIEELLGTATREYAETANLAQVAFDLASQGGGGSGFTPTLFNTAGTSSLRGVDVVGFVDAATDLDARMQAQGL